MKFRVAVRFFPVEVFPLGGGLNARLGLMNDIYSFLNKVFGIIPQLAFDIYGYECILLYKPYTLM